MRSFSQVSTLSTIGGLMCGTSRNSRRCNTNSNNYSGGIPTSVKPADGGGASVEEWLKSFSHQDDTKSSTPKLSPKAQAKYNYLVDRMPSEIRESIKEAQTGISDSMDPEKLTSYQRRLVLERFSQAATARMSTRIEDTVREDPMGAQRLGIRLSDEDPNKQASSDLDATMLGDFSSRSNSGSDICENGANGWHAAANILMDTSIPPFIRDEIMEEIVAARGKRDGGRTQHDITMEDLVRLHGDLEMDANTNGDDDAIHSTSVDLESHRNLKETFSQPIIVPRNKKMDEDTDSCELANPGRFHEIGKRLKVAKVDVSSVPPSSGGPSSATAAKLASIGSKTDESGDEDEDFVQGIRWSGAGNIDAFTHPPQPPLAARNRMLEEEEEDRAKKSDRVIDFTDLKPLE